MRILLVAGDPSGDLYASMLARALKARRPGVRLEAVGGELTRRALGEGDAFLHDLASAGVTGFVEPLKRLPMLARVLGTIRGRLAARPDAVVCVDFYGFNRRVLEAAARAGVPAYYFISPQVWASRPGRVRRLKRWARRMLVIFPFEEDLYRKAGVPVTWVGHPLLDLLPAPPEERAPGPLRLGLLPGSRASEVRRHLGLMLEAASIILKDYPETEVSVFAAPSLGDESYRPLLERWRTPDGRRARLTRESGYAERAALDLALSSSGTATLENALLGLPMVVVYKLSWPTYWLARAMIRVPYIAMANLLAGRRLVPELIQSDAAPRGVARAALDLLASPRRLQALKGELAALRGKLGGPGATDRAAEALLKELDPAPEEARR